MGIFGSVEPLSDYFPTKAFVRATALMRSFLIAERDRLDALALTRNREKAIDNENLVSEMPSILSFCEGYQNLFMRYLTAVMPQHPHGVRCGPGCGNCCKHFPMSVEPFELIFLYAFLRTSDSLLDSLEKCLSRTHRFYAIREKAEGEGGGDPEEKALHAYFNEGHPCPFILQSGSCGVYEHRPVTCRMYFSETDPQFCVSEYLQTERNRSFIVYLPDDIEELIADISTHYESLALPESLYDGLLAMNSMESAFTQGHL